MSVYSGMLRLSTQGHGEIVDITEGVRSVVGTSGVEVGLVSVFAVGATVAVTTMEHEPGGVRDLQALLERLIPVRPEGGEWSHNALNGDTNAHAHLRAAVIGPSVTVPVLGGELAVGTWQQVVLIDFDDRPRSRTVSVHVLA
jgi:secondary thiamine-phosphate synthase enzyme